jgi:hypothetical protein
MLKLRNHFLFTILVAVFFVSCKQENVSRIKIKDVFSFSQVEVVEIDGCEYIFVPNGNASWGTHKGNCKFCLSRSAKNY